MKGNVIIKGILAPALTCIGYVLFFGSFTDAASKPVQTCTFICSCVLACLLLVLTGVCLSAELRRRIIHPIKNKNNNMESIEFSFFSLFLKYHLHDINDTRQDDILFISSNARRAEVEFEESRRNGNTVFEAQEKAMSVLTGGI